MSNQNRIALFVDIDNMPLTKEHIDNIVNQLEQSGDIVFARFYGVTDRRHRDIICDAVARGFETVPPVNPKKRGSTKVFDNRILVDLCELVYTNMSISSVAIVANPTNLVHLFAKLKKEDIGIYACDNLDDDSLLFVDEILQFGYDDPNTAAKNRQPQREESAAQAEEVKPQVEEVEAVEEETTAAQEVEETFEQAEETAEQAEPQEVAEETAEEQPAEEAPVEEAHVAEEPVEDDSDDSLDILRQIQQMKEDIPSSEEEEDAELIEKIKKLLDEFN